MPIRPEMKHRYPPPKEWKTIRARIMARAGDECECVGQCGLSHDNGRCSAPHREFVDRKRGPDGRYLARWTEHHHDGACVGGDCEATLVVLTIAHLDHEPSHNENVNLAALCQLCHLRLDRHEHVRNAADTRARKRDERTGQRRLFAGGR